MTGAAVAQDDPNTFCTDGFPEADADAGGTISAQEASEARAVGFSTIDQNGDGMISRQEYLECSGKRAESAASASVAMSSEDVRERTEMTDLQYIHVDRDDDGTITREEFMTWMEETHRGATEPTNVETTSSTGSTKKMWRRGVARCRRRPDREEMSSRAAQ